MVYLVRLEQKVESFALQTRLIILFFQVIFNAVIPDHDAEVFNPPTSPTHNQTAVDSIVDIGVGGLRRWDAVYFIHVAEHGYIYENAIAFFPLYPVMVGKIADVFYCFSFAGQIMSKLNLCLIIGVALNVYFFTKSASTLFHLGVQVLKDERLAYKAALLFCITPASIFMTAPYSECLFTYLFFSGLLAFASGDTMKAAFWFGLSASTRSNGLVAIGFILFRRAKGFMSSMQQATKARFETMTEKGMMMASMTYLYLTPAIVAVVLCAGPFCLYQYYIYRIFCLSNDADLPNHLVRYGRSQNYKLVSDAPSPWCSQLLPLSYSYIQKHHWGVGFLQYYELKQVPNFLLAAPMLVLSVCACVYYYRLNTDCCHRLGMVQEGQTDKKTDLQKGNFGFKNTRLFIYVGHLVFMTVFGIFFAHIQIMTRLLASTSPVIYWFAARLITERTYHDNFSSNQYNIFSPGRVQRVERGANLQQAQKGNLLIDQISDFWKQSTNTKLVLFYFMVYFVVGTAAFANFLPWT
ncbi:GPI mannosyltransferase 2-like [Haliotis cracherodii]|uniref:GPI mannosyltransferase 2-like n=1 Tax=Haliotis cracherodii TaxID=6455 RepID=UPI0039E747E4